MAYGDGSGPASMGPMTGRGLGFCAGYGQPGYMAPLPGRGAWHYGGRGMSARGFGGGGGRGFRNRFYATGLTGWQQAYAGYAAAAPEQELDALRNQVKFMEDSVRKTQERIQELEQQAEDK